MRLSLTQRPRILLSSGLALWLGCDLRVSQAPSPASGAASLPKPSATLAPVPQDAGAADGSLLDAQTRVVSAEAPDEADGNDESEARPPLGGPEPLPVLPARATWVRVGAASLSLQRICDLKVFKDALYAAHARQPLGTDGATVSKYHLKLAPPTQKPSERWDFSVAFDWNRHGEPAKDGGAGQGFLRVHHASGRLFVPDADPPYAGFGIADWGTEGFVFISDTQGKFAPPTAPHYRPPVAVNLERAGAAVLPRAYHVIDTIRYRGHYYASTGSVPPKERAWNGPSPGALHVASDDLSKWTYVVGYPVPYQRACGG
jgi:hypothetical protein